MGQTSTFGASLPVLGFEVAIGSSASPPVYTVVANGSDMSLPLKGDVVDVTNFGDTWHRRVSTLRDMGKITFKVFYVPNEPTHDTAQGLRGLLANGTLTPIQFIYPDGATDAFPAYVTGFNVTGKVGGVFEAAVELTNNGAPTLA